MEPVDYVKVVKNHWKVVVVLVLFAVVAVYFTSPKTPSRAYTAEHIVRLEQLVPESPNSNVLSVSLLATGGEVPRRAAAALGYDGDPLGLAQCCIEATADPDFLTITLTGSGGTPDEAVERVNAFGQELVTFIGELEEERVANSVARAQEEVNAAQQRVDTLRNQDQAQPGNAEVQGQLDQAIAALLDAQDTVDAARARTTYVTLQEAVSASEDAAFVAGFGREQRAIIAGVFALVFGIGLTIILDRSDSRLRTKEQVERRFGLPVLAEVPQLALRDRSRAAVVAFERENRVAEAYRGLRTALLLFRGQGENTPSNGANGHGYGGYGSTSQQQGVTRQLVVITSPEAGDGKSTTAANLAMAYAEAGQSVLLVSWDLWRPLSPGVFNAEEGPGVVEYLNGNASSLVPFVQDTSIPGVRIVTAGLGGHHTYTQIENARRLLQEARTLANVVIVDTAPILSTSVTRELVTLADAVVVVCRAGRTIGPVADRCAELLERLGAPALGVVLVGVATGPFADYYGAPRETKPTERPRFRARFDAPVEPRHKAPPSAPQRPTAAQYRATTPRGPESRELR